MDKHGVRRWNERERWITELDPESDTHVSFQSECDIGRILNRYAEVGGLPPSTKQAVYADVTSLQSRDLTSAYNESQRVIDIFETSKEVIKNARKKAQSESQESQSSSQRKKDLEDAIREVLKADSQRGTPPVT